MINHSYRLMLTIIIKMVRMTMFEIGRFIHIVSAAGHLKDLKHLS